MLCWMAAAHRYPYIEARILTLLCCFFTLVAVAFGAAFSGAESLVLSYDGTKDKYIRCDDPRTLIRAVYGYDILCVGGRIVGTSYLV